MQILYILMRWLQYTDKMTRLLSLLIVSGVVFLGVGCKKLVHVPVPSTIVNADNVFQTDASAISALNGIYIQMNENVFTAPGVTTMSFLPGLSADELGLITGVISPSMVEYYTNSLNTTTNTLDFWTGIYPVIYSCNAAIEGINAATTLTPAIKQQLLGEALFCRAFHYFYLVNLYGDVPLILSPDYTINATTARTPQAQAWQQIISDLTSAQKMLSANYLDATLLQTTGERTRPTQWAAAALLARSYLYTQKWDSAVIEATVVINNTGLYSLDSLNMVFQMNSTEAIWQLQPVLPGYNTVDATVFVLPPTGPNVQSNPAYLNPTLVGAFENGDERRSVWVDSVTVTGSGAPVTYYFPYKYTVADLGQPVSEYEMVLRLGEQLLIRSEAEAELADLGDASADLNVIRRRAGLLPTTATTQSGLIAALMHERQVELFTEWGHRWLDLKRTGSVDAVMTVQCPLKGGTWDDHSKLYPIPATEIAEDPKLVQNPGY